MYRCAKCNQLSAPGEPANVVVVKTRVKAYHYREFAMRRGRGLLRKWIADPGGHGIETAKEELRHEGCL